MYLRLLCIVLVLCTLTAASVLANTFTLPVSLTGDYTHGLVKSVDLDFGTSFSSVQSLKISWSGYGIAGWVDYHPYAARLIVSMPTDTGGMAKYGETPQYGVNTYPQAQSFSTVTNLSSFGGYTSWDFLLDGRGTIKAELDWLAGWIGSPPVIGSYSRVHIDSASVVMEATPVVPEPTGLAALITGLVSTGTFTIRRRKI